MSDDQEKAYGVSPTSMATIKAEIAKYIGVENSKRQQILSIIDEFFGAKNSGGRVEKFGEFGLLLAGGTINSIYSGRLVNDLDFYMKDLDKKSEIVAYFTEVFGEPKYESDNAITFWRKSGKKKYEVQLITRFSGTPQEILNTFDFTIVQGCYDFSEKKFVLSENFLIDIASRTLRYTTSSHYPICAFIRTKKYQDRGYHLTNSCRLAISLAINQLDLSTYRNLRDQLIGIDTCFLKGFLETLDDDKELTDQERMEFIETCCTLIDNHISESFGIASDGDGEPDFDGEI